MSDISQVISALFALLAFAFSLWAFKRSAALTHYGALDQMYSDLLKLAIEHPHLRIPNANRTPEEQRRYSIYAHLAWCFVESVYDHSKLNGHLMHSWRSAIAIEAELHRDWFEAPEKRFMFKEELHEFIAREFPKPKSPNKAPEPTP